MSVLSSADRDLVVKMLFDAGEGANFLYGRVPIGASDYAMDRYSLEHGLHLLQRNDAVVVDFVTRTFRRGNDCRPLGAAVAVAVTRHIKTSTNGKARGRASMTMQTMDRQNGRFGIARWLMTNLPWLSHGHLDLRLRSA